MARWYRPLISPSRRQEVGITESEAILSYTMTFRQPRHIARPCLKQNCCRTIYKRLLFQVFTYSPSSLGMMRITAVQDMVRVQSQLWQLNETLSKWMTSKKRTGSNSSCLSPFNAFHHSGGRCRQVGIYEFKARQVYSVTLSQQKKRPGKLAWW